MDDLGFAHRLADLADEISLEAFQSKGDVVDHKADGSTVTSVDVQIEQRLASEIVAAQPDDELLSEELRAERHATAPTDGGSSTGSISAVSAVPPD